MSKEQQPAKLSYFFGKGYTDLWETIKGAFERNWEVCKEVWGKWWGDGKYVSLLAISCCACLLVFGSIWTFALSLIHILVLGVFFLFVYIGFGIVWLVDRIYILFHHISTACPNPECQEHFRLPAYVCQCGRIHTNLTPGKYGILKRKCLCGNKLPTTFFNGRDKIPAVCPHCHTSLKGSFNRQLSIPVIGGRSSGKTCFINMAVTLFKDQIAPERGWTFEYYDESDRIAHESAFHRLGSGNTPTATNDHRLTAYKFMLSQKAWSVPKQIYIYDVAGEIFSSAFEVGAQRAYGYSNGFLILVDPFCLPEFAASLDSRVVNAAGSVQADLNDMLDVLLVNLEKMFSLKSKDMLKTSVAVVINKVDVGNLEDTIGDSAVDRHMTEHPECKSRLAAQNALCEGFLTEYGASNFVRVAKSKFNTLQYFTCSTLGHEPNGTMFEPIRVDDAILWLLNKADNTIQ